MRSGLERWKASTTHRNSRKPTACTWRPSQHLSQLSPRCRSGTFPTGRRMPPALCLLKRRMCRRCSYLAWLIRASTNASSNGLDLNTAADAMHSCCFHRAFTSFAKTTSGLKAAPQCLMRPHLRRLASSVMLLRHIVTKTRSHHESVHVACSCPCRSSALRGTRIDRSRYVLTCIFTHFHIRPLKAALRCAHPHNDINLLE